jgi:hypothetical protein
MGDQDNPSFWHQNYPNQYLLEFWHDLKNDMIKGQIGLPNPYPGDHNHIFQLHFCNNFESCPIPESDQITSEKLGPEHWDLEVL